jgi:phosphatidylglycerophosphate synthase
MMFIIKKYKNLYKDLNKHNPMDLIIERFFRVLGFYGALILRPTPITANQVTIFRSVFMLAAFFFFTGIYKINGQYYLNLIASGIMIFIWEVLDYADGTLARMRKKASNYGAWLEQCIDRVFGASHGLLGFGVAIGIYLESKSVWPLIALFFMLYGWELFIHFVNLEKHTQDVKVIDWKIEARNKRESFLGRLVFNIMRFSEIFIMLGCFIYYPIMIYFKFNILLWVLIAYACLYNLLWIYLASLQYKYMHKM